MSSTQTATTDTSRAKRKRRWLGGAGLAVALAGAAAVAALTLPGQTQQRYKDQALFQAKRGPLTISVAASGDLSSQEATVIRNQVEGDTTVLTLVDQGTVVEKGDILAELDASSLEDEKEKLLIDVENAQAEKVTAEQNLQITKQQNEADILAARVDYELAKLDFRKYLGAPPPDRLTDKPEGPPQSMASEQSASPEQTETGEPQPTVNGMAGPDGASAGNYDKVMARINKLNAIPLGTTPDYERMMNKISEAGEKDSLSRLLESAADDADRRIQKLLDRMDGQYKQNIQSELNTIRIAQAELKRAVDRLAGSITLENKGYITETELEADKLEVKRLQSELQQARGSLRLRRTFTFQRELANLRNQLEQKEFTLKKARTEARSNLVEARANLKSKQSKLKQLKSRLAEVKRQIKACTVRAPKDGVVVYVKPDHAWDEMIGEGAEVDERQKMFRLPSSKQMVATVNLHQSVVDKVETGMPARVRTNGTDRSFTGRVRKVNRLPDTSSSRRASNQKIYKCEIVVDSKGQLRPGMNVQAEIIVKRFDEATYVPVQAVVQRDGKPTVYLPTAQGPQPRAVKLGLNNNTMVRVTAGLEPGESVLLTPPLQNEDNERAPEGASDAEAKPVQDNTTAHR